MSKRHTLKLVAACAMVAAAALPGLAQAQTKLKWAHVYETSEPYHKWSVWAGEEFKKRTNGKYEIQVFPASSLGKESDINQGLQLGTVDIILTGASFASNSYPRLAVSYYPFTFRDADHVIAYGKSDIFKELTEGYKKATGNTVTEDVPTTGQFSTPGRGAGISSVLFCTAWISCRTESPSELISIAVGATISTMPTTTHGADSSTYAMRTRAAGDSGPTEDASSSALAACGCSWRA